MSKKLIDGVRIKGVSAYGEFGEQVVSGSITMGVTAEPTLELTLADRMDMWLTERARDLFNAGTTITFRDEVYQLTQLTVGGDQAPTISVQATMDTIVRLKDHKKAESWGESDVSKWAENQIERFLATAVVQEGLGTRTIDQEADDQTPENGESRWDVLAEMAKEVGAWVFGTDDTIIFGKPSWLAQRQDATTLTLQWDSWTDHSDALVAAPFYTWTHEKKSWEGQETLELELLDPADSDAPLMSLRPGDIVHFAGKAVPSKEPLWLIHEIRRPLVLGESTSITCWRPIDPPEMVDKNAGGDDEISYAGVPDGPIGRYGWDGDQLKNAAAIVKEGLRREVKEIGLVLAVMTAMQESKLEILDHGDEMWGVTNPDGTATTSKGLFQQQDPWGPLAVRMSATGSAGLFYDQLVNLPYETIKDAVSGSRLINEVQRSNFPDAYAQWWEDAHAVVKACLEAKASIVSGGAHTGELGARINKVISALDGQSIDNDGNGAWCVDLADQFAQDLMGIPRSSIYGDGKDYYKNPALMSHFTPVRPGEPMKKGDIVTWSGTHGAYTNRLPGMSYGAGHVAVYVEHRNGTAYFLSQMPGRSSIRPLSTDGIIGMMRPKKDT